MVYKNTGVFTSRPVLPRSTVSHARASMASGAGSRARRHGTPDRRDEEPYQPIQPTGADGVRLMYQPSSPKGADGERIWYQPSSPGPMTVSDDDDREATYSRVLERMVTPEVEDSDHDHDYRAAQLLSKSSTSKTKEDVAKKGDEKGEGSKRKGETRKRKGREGKEIDHKKEEKEPKKGKRCETAHELKVQGDKIWDQELEIKKLKEDNLKLKEDLAFHVADASNKLEDNEALRKKITELRRGDDIDEVIGALQRRFDSECDFSYSTHAYPVTFIKLTDTMREEARRWGQHSDPSLDNVAEPDLKDYDIHKYLGLFVAGRNLAMAAQHLHGEVVRTVDRMTDRYIAEEHDMTETLTCPILKTGPFKDPVTIGSGITFERSAILDWFAKETEDQGAFAEHRCPSTRKIVEPVDIQPNVIVKQIQDKHRRDFKKDYPTKFSTPLDTSMPYVRMPALRLEEGENVGGVDGGDYCKIGPETFPPRYFDAMDYHRTGGGKCSFSFD